MKALLSPCQTELVLASHQSGTLKLNVSSRIALQSYPWSNAPLRVTCGRTPATKLFGRLYGHPQTAYRLGRDLATPR